MFAYTGMRLLLLCNVVDLVLFMVILSAYFYYSVINVIFFFAWEHFTRYI